MNGMSLVEGAITICTCTSYAIVHPSVSHEHIYEIVHLVSNRSYFVKQMAEIKC